MKIKYLFFLLLGTLLIAGCAGGPEPEPEQPPEEAPAEEAPAVEEEPEEEPVPSTPDDLLADAQKLQEQIETYGLAQYAPALYEDGEQRYEAGEEAYLNEDFEKAEAELTFAVEAYQQVFEEGMTIIVGDTRERAASARQAAREAKAHVAVRQSYSPVEQRFDNGEQALQNREYVTALTAFREVIPRYQDLRERAVELRQEAEEALQQARDSRQRGETRRQELESDAERDLEEAAGEEVAE